MLAIEALALSKKFDEKYALDHLDLRVEKGAIFGFLGPNGAGKTTTLRLLVGLARPSSGTANILGLNIDAKSREIQKKIGYLPETPVFYGWMTAREYLTFIGNIFQLTSSKLKTKIDYLLELVGLIDVNMKIRGFSKGMRQRLGVAQALVNSPEVLFLDEPTSALDPMGRKEVLDMIELLANEITVFFSTHILSDVERVCDSVAILNKGRLMIESDIHLLKEKYAQHSFQLEFDSDPKDFVSRLKSYAWVTDVVSDGNVLKIKPNDMEKGQSELLPLIANSGLRLNYFKIVEPSLENIFIKIVDNHE